MGHPQRTKKRQQRRELNWGGKQWAVAASRWLRHRFMGRYRRRIEYAFIGNGNYPATIYRAGRTAVVAATLSQSGALDELFQGARYAA